MANEMKQAIVLAPKVQAVADSLLNRNIGREKIVRASLLALVSGHPAFFLGSPGINKTGTVQDLVGRIVGAEFYDALMPTIVSVEQLLVEKTSIVESVDGNGVKSISTSDTLGRAANAHVLFADEIWKAEPRVLQTLLDLSKGDGVRHEGQMVETPLLAFIAASNELPDPEGNLGAMWSRMTIRAEVQSLSARDKKRLVAVRLKRDRMSDAGAVQTLTLDEIECLRFARPHVDVSEGIIDTVLEIFNSLREDENEDFGWLWDDDRRFGRVFDVMQANALLDGRDTVNQTDLRVLEFLLWDTPEQIPTVQAMLAPYTRTPLGDAKEVVDALFAPEGNVDKARKGDRQVLVPALTQIDEAVATLAELKGEASDTETSEIDTLLDELENIKQEIADAATGRRR